MNSIKMPNYNMHAGDIARGEGQYEYHLQKAPAQSYLLTFRSPKLKEGLRTCQITPLRFPGVSELTQF